MVNTYIGVISLVFPPNLNVHIIYYKKFQIFSFSLDYISNQSKRRQIT